MFKTRITLNNVFAPMMYKADFALVNATFNRFSSAKKLLGSLLTHDIIIISFSFPWKLSTVFTVTCTLDPILQHTRHQQRLYNQLY